MKRQKTNKLVNFITELAQNPTLLSQFKADPEAVLAKARLSDEDLERLSLFKEGPVGSIVYSVEIDIDEDAQEKSSALDISFRSPITYLKNIPVKVVEGNNGPFYGHLSGEIDNNNGVISMDVHFDQNGEPKELKVERKRELQTFFTDGKAETRIKKTEVTMFVEEDEYPADFCGTIDFENGVNLIIQCYPQKDKPQC